VSAILGFRERHAPDPSVPHWHSRLAQPDAHRRLVDVVEWKLIEMPLPRLQMRGRAYRPFIYEIHWDQRIRRADVARYQSGGGTFDNRVLFRPGVGEYLLQLNGLLRPLIQRRWAAMVAELNRLEDSQLETFLFGASRAQTARIRSGLWDLQDGRCFYCDAGIRDAARAQVDHFIPWARYPDEGIDNLVATHVECNGFKSSSLAAAVHLARWAQRFAPDTREHLGLGELAERTAWVRHRDVSRNVARAIYLRLPPDASLWLRGRNFVTPDTALIHSALGASATIV
jgi:5-methylcytosine-specific restriction endonuclease McrA